MRWVMLDDIFAGISRCSVIALAVLYHCVSLCLICAPLLDRARDPVASCRFVLKLHRRMSLPR